MKDDVEALRDHDEYAGVCIYPIGVMALVNHGELIAQIIRVCAEEKITIDTFTTNPTASLLKLLPYIPETLSVLTRREKDNVDFPLDVAAGIIAVAIRQNVKYLKNIFGSLAMAVTQGIQVEESTES